MLCCVGLQRQGDGVNVEGGEVVVVVAKTGTSGKFSRWKSVVEIVQPRDECPPPLLGRLRTLLLIVRYRSHGSNVL